MYSNISHKLKSFTGIMPKLPYEPPKRASSPLRENVVWKHVYGPEDREAVQHLAEDAPSGTFEDLPRAARVAMILRADEIAREEGRPDRVVGFLAAAVRSGKPEVAANFNPHRLERILGNLLGGRQGAMQALWTPEVSRLVERYQTERKVVLERIQAMERAIPEEGGGKSGPGSAGLPVPAGTASGMSVGTQAPSPIRRAENRTLEALLQRNDILHLSTHGENRRQQLMERAEGQAARSLPAGAGAGGITRSEIALPAENAPARRAGGGVEAVEQARRTDDKRTLEGRLTLVSANGETIGSAILDGSDHRG